MNMKRLLSLLIVGLFVLFATVAQADTIKTSGALTGADGSLRPYGIDVYRIMLNGTAATSGLALYDSNATSLTNEQPATAAQIKFEVYEATSGEGHYIDFGDNPLHFEYGCYYMSFDAAFVIHYR